MRIIKEVRLLILRDIIIGFYHVRYRLLLASLFIVLISIMSIYHFKQHAIITNTALANYTFTDLVAYLFQGVDFSFINNPGAAFPFIWLVFMIICPFIIGDYCREDIHNQSSMLFVRVRSRFSIWLSKLLFNFIIVLSFYFVLLVFISIITLIFFSGSFEWGEYSLENVKPFLTTDISAFSFTIQAILLPIFVCTALSTIYSLLSVFVNPVYVLLGILALLIASLFSTTLLLPGSYGMIERFYLLDSGLGFTWLQIILYFLISVILVIIIGYYFFKRTDIMGLRGE